MSRYVVVPASRRADRLKVHGGNLLADVRCHALSSRAVSTRVFIQPASRIIHIGWVSFYRGAAAINYEAMRSGDITLELTGRERAAHNITGEDEHESHAVERSGSMSC